MTDTLLARHAATDRVAFGGSGKRSANDLLRDAAAVADALPERTDRPLALLGVRRDLYACLAALLGAWERGYEVLLPAADTTREGFLRLAQRCDVGAVLHDTASSAALPIGPILASALPGRRLPDARCVLQGVLQLAAADGNIASRLVGSQLLHEAQCFGRSLALPEGGAYATTLLPTTRYAWAAAVFWPLLSGGALLRDDPREQAWADQLSGVELIGAPAQLRMLARRSPRALTGVKQVVSLGAPLPAAAFAALDELGLSVRDVYATAEQGCLGQRSAADQSFQPLLEKSHHGGFHPTGARAQRAEWEERIAWLEGVHDAALLHLEAEDRNLLALSFDPAAPESELRARVADVLPQLVVAEWRSVRPQDSGPHASFASGRCDLTRNGAGRHDRTSVLRLFGRSADTTPLSWALVLQSEQSVPERSVRHVQVPERYGYFEGHFPGYPLLPGAAQLSELVVPFVRAVRPELGRLTRMARLKFQERIVPNDLIEVSLAVAADPVAHERSIEFALRRGDSLCASGRLWFAAVQEPSA